MSRTKKTAINSTVGLACTILSSILSFVLRALFVRLLGFEYAGVNSLFTDILSILNLVDLGFGNAILYRLYKTIAQKDDTSTEALLALYKKICYIIAAIIGIAGLVFVPFLGAFVKEAPSFSEPLWSLYLIVLFTSVLSHLINYKSVLIVAKQDRYISTIIQYCCIFLRHGLQIISLAVFRSIYLYLLSSAVSTLVQGIVVGIVSKRRYHLSWNSKVKVPQAEVKTLVKDIGALSIYKLCRTLDATIDTFLISKFVDVVITGIYGSISMVFSALNELLAVFNDGMIASIGDLNASGDKEHLSKVFDQSVHFTYLLYGVCTVTLVPFISGFSSWWIGCSLDDACLYVMLVNFFMYGFGMNVATFRNAMGIFRKGWIRPAITAGLNLIFSLFLVTKIGLIGTLLGTLLARICTLVWYDPWLVIRHGFGKSPVKYYLRYLLYIIITGSSAFVMVLLSRVLPQMDNSLISLLWHGVLYLVVAVLLVVGIGFAFPEQKSILKRLFSLLPLKKEKSQSGKN